LGAFGIYIEESGGPYALAESGVSFKFCLKFSKFKRLQPL